MSGGHDWFYADASSQRVGLMVCMSCRQPITEGEYRYRETDEAYIPHHRACSEHDPQWAIDDAKAAEQRALLARRYAAAQAFVREWGVTDLNDILSDDAPLREPVQCDCGQPATAKYEGDDMCEKCATYCARRDFEESEMPGGFA